MIMAILMLTPIMVAAMSDGAGLYKLLAWMSPGYPVGAYTYSHGLETAVENGSVTDDSSAKDWIATILGHGAGFADTVFLAHAHRAASSEDSNALRDVAELAAAFSATRELALETRAQGAAFIEITRNAWPSESLGRLTACWDGPIVYPVAVGVSAAGHGIELSQAAPAFLHAVAANLVSAVVRLVPLGQTQGQRVLAALEPLVAEAANRALQTELEEVSSSTMMIDICSMNHEIQHTRLFRS